MALAIGVSASSMGSACKKAVAPIVVDMTRLDIAAGSGNTATVFHEVASGDPSIWGGQIISSSCDRIKVDITYLDGDDCDPCTNPDTLVEKVITQYIEKDMVGIQIPDGYWVKVEVTVVDSSNAPIASVNGTSVTGGAAWNPSCSDCVVNRP